MKLSKKTLLSLTFLLIFRLFAQNASVSNASGKISETSATDRNQKNWYICSGSFKNEQNANQRMQILKDKGIESFIVSFEKTPGDIYLRVLIDESFLTLNEAHKKLAEYNSGNIFKSLGITGLWCCQSERQIEIEEGRYILIKDSDTGNPVAEADVNIDKKWDTKSSEEGKAPLPKDVPDGEHEITVTKGDEYVATESKIVIEENKISGISQIALPKAVDYDRIKIILEWGEYPYDLDSHIIESYHHVYFSNMYEANMDLDLDDTSSYGPETVTIKNPEKGKLYKYYVFNYSDNSSFPLSKRLSDSFATVKVYFGNEFKKSFSITPNQEGILWHVFDIENGEIVEVNKVEPKSLRGISYDGDFEIRLANFDEDNEKNECAENTENDELNEVDENSADATETENSIASENQDEEPEGETENPSENEN